VSTLDELVAALSDPAIYPGNPQRVDVRQTHASIAFLAGDAVYKLKKPVNFGFLDYSTMTRRRRMCKLEVSLNQRLAPEVYLGVERVTRRTGGQYRLGGRGQVVDYLVHMRRLPDDAALSARLQADAVEAAEIEAVARKIAYFHRDAGRRGLFNAFGRPHLIARNVSENFEQTAESVGRTITPAAYTEIVSYASEFLSAHMAVFQERVDAGHICDGHGDLRCEHVYLTDPLQIIDCIEFNDRLRYGDVASDLGFLAMDIEAYGAPELAALLVAHYEAVADVTLAPVLDFYCCYRAYVRGKVASLRLQDADISPAEARTTNREAQRYFHLARRYTRGSRRPQLILMSGVSGSGKSTLARELSAILAAPRIESDSVRKQLAGLKPTTRRRAAPGEDIYSAEMSERVYAELLTAAERQLSRGRSVILDATYQRRAHRAPARELARQHGAELRVLACHGSDELIRERLRKRTDDASATSDAGLEVYLDQLKHYEPVDELPPGEAIAVDAALGLDAQLNLVLDDL
jgi:hypothetical protein